MQKRLKVEVDGCTRFSLTHTRRASLPQQAKEAIFPLKQFVAKECGHALHSAALGAAENRKY